MKKMYVFPLLLAALLLQAGAAADSDSETLIRESVTENFPEFDLQQVRPSPIAGLYEVLLDGEVVYMSADGRYIVQGSMFDLEMRVNLTEEVRSATRIQALRQVPADEMIEFAPEHPEHVVYVFTDVDCGFCQRLHKDIKALNRQGIAVRYLAFPRAGIGSETYENMAAVWCSEDRRQALTNAKQGADIKAEQCADPVSRHYELGLEIGVRGTPAVFTEQGVQIGGYLSPEEMLAELQD